MVRSRLNAARDAADASADDERDLVLPEHEQELEVRVALCSFRSAGPFLFSESHKLQYDAK